MYLTERTSIPLSMLPLSELRAHLRIGTGFGEESLQDNVLEAALRSAIEEIERLTGMALVRREFLLRLPKWSRSDSQWLPRGPVVEISEIAIRRPDGRRSLVDSSRYRSATDGPRPVIGAAGFALPSILVGGEAEILFVAGFGMGWNDIPRDLSLATLSLAAARYEDRSGAVELPPGVKAVVAFYRPLRVSGVN